MSIKVLTVDNFWTWSWPGVFDGMRSFFNGEYTFERVVRDSKGGILINQDDHDLVLLENTDSLKLVCLKHQVILRLGGFAMNDTTLLTEPSVYDKAMQQVGAIITTNQTLQELGKRNNSDTFLIPNGLDLSHFVTSNKLGASVPFVIGFAGNIKTAAHMRYKGYPQIAGAHARLFVDGVQLKTALYGTEQISRKDMVEKFYSKIDCLISASKNEGCSNVIMEALACGVPVLCTKVGYHGHTLTQGVNCLFIIREANDIETKVRMLMNDSTLWHRLSNNGRKFAEQHHDARDTARAYKDIFDLCIAKQNQH